MDSLQQNSTSLQETSERQSDFRGKLLFVLTAAPPIRFPTLATAGSKRPPGLSLP